MWEHIPKRRHAKVNRAHDPETDCSCPTRVCGLLYKRVVSPEKLADPQVFVSLSFGSESLLEVYIPSHLNIGYVQQGGGVQNGFGVWGVTIIRETQQGTLRTTTHSHEIQIPARRKRQSHERDGTALYIPGAPASFNKASILPKSTTP